MNSRSGKKSRRVVESSEEESDVDAHDVLDGGGDGPTESDVEMADGGEVNSRPKGKSDACSKVAHIMAAERYPVGSYVVAVYDGNGTWLRWRGRSRR